MKRLSPSSIATCICFGILLPLLLLLLINLYGGIDTAFHLFRIKGLALHIENGAYPCSLYEHMCSGYGYAAPLFYGDLILLPFAYLYSKGLPLGIVYRLLIYTLVILCILIPYFSSIWFGFKPKSSLLFSFSLLLSPLFIIALFYWQQLGTITAFVFFPSILFPIFVLLTRQTTFRIRLQASIWLIGGILCVLLNHFISFVIVLLFITVFGLCRLPFLLHNKANLYTLLISGVLCALLGSFFWMPLLEQYYFNNLEVFCGRPLFNLLDYYHKVPILALFLPLGFLNLQSVSRLLPQWLLAPHETFCIYGWLFFSFLIVLFKYRKSLNIALWVKCALCGSLVLTLMMTSRTIMSCLQHFLSWLQFPIRFATLLTTLFLPCYIYVYTQLKHSAPKIVLIIAFFVASLLGFLTPVSIHIYTWMFLEKPASVNIDAPKIGIINGEFLPHKWASLYLKNAKQSDAIKHMLGESAHPVSTLTVINSPTTIVFPRFFYLGYSAICDGHPCDVIESEEGLLAVNVPTGLQGDVTVAYTGTTIQHWSWRITYLTAILILIGSFLVFIYKMFRRIICRFIRHPL